MKPLRIADSETAILSLQDEIRRSEESRYNHRLHGVLLVAQGMTCREAAGLLGDSPRTVEYWVRNYSSLGFSGLGEEERTGRPSRLSETQLKRVEIALRSTPSAVGLEGHGQWDGKSLSEYLKQEFGVTLETRQCQRLFRKFGFRFRKPRPEIAHADAVQQAACKKN